MSNKSIFCFVPFMAVAMCLPLHAGAASVGPNGYTNDFSARPAATDFSTSGGISGGAGDISSVAEMDSLVQNLAAGTITSQVSDSSPANPPVKLSTAQWTSGGAAYLVTRPTGNAASVLMATLVNNTGTNCNLFEFSYQLTVGVSVSEEVPGQRLYYSFSAATNSWTSLPAVSGINASRIVSANVPLNQVWANGAKLYLLWVDDNAADSTESAYEIDNFFASASYTSFPLSITLTAPDNGQHFGLSTAISASVDLTGSPTNVSYYVDGTLATTRTSTPFTPVNLPAQALGTHTVYATASDAETNLVTTVTNSFIVDVALSGTLSSNTTLFAANSPYTVSGNLTVPSGVTLTIEPGTTVQLGANARVLVDGCIQAVGGTGKRIRFTHSTASDWSGFSFNGNHQSNVFAYVDFEYASGSGNSGSAVLHIDDSQVTFERDTFLNMFGHKYMDVWWPEVTIRNCVFGDVGASFMIMVENLQENGWFIVDGNIFGTNTGDNDIFHLNHVSVKNGPKATIVNNVFTGAGDDHVDDNESDSHIEGNLFLNLTTNHPPRSAACAVTTGEGSGVSTNLHTQRLVLVRNVFWGCDYGLINKDGSAVEIYNCIFVNNRGGIIFDEPWRTDSGAGRSCYIESCIFWNNWAENGIDEGTFAYLTNSAAYTTGRYYRGATQVTVNNSILPTQYHYLGTGNIEADPMFAWPTNLLNLTPTNPAFADGFNGFDGNAFIITNRLIPDVRLLPGSPAIGAGANGTDMGIFVSDNATITGEPPAMTSQTGAVLTIGGLDIDSYKYRLAGPGFTNSWSQEIQPWKYVPDIAINATTATATCAGHGFADGDTIEVKGADSICPYYNGSFVIQNVTSNTFDFTVSPGTNLLTPEPLTIVWPIRNEGVTDIWCRKPQHVELSGLGNGTYRVEAIRKNSQGVWQNANTPTVSKSWTVSLAEAAQLSAPHFAGQDLIFQFNPVSGQTYSVLYIDTLGNGAAWQKLLDIPAQPNSDSFRVTNAAPGSVTRFYRIATPAQP